MYISGSFYYGDASGEVECLDSDGFMYNGNMINNKKDGFGTEIHSDGDVYIGYFANNKRHGKG